MISLLLVCSALAASPPDRATPDAIQAYQEIKTRTGPGADAQVRLALWCERHGLQAERLAHLARAIVTDPTHAVARGLLGHVHRDGRWQSPESVARASREDGSLAARLAEYNARRERAGETQQAQWDLALWCEKAGLADEAIAHFSAVTRLEPDRARTAKAANGKAPADLRAAAWKKLGCKPYNGRWLTDTQIAAEKSEAKAREKADRRWTATLERWRNESANRLQCDEAETKLASITDPRAVPAVVAVFGSRGASDQLRAAQILGQIDAPEASRGLASLSVFGASENVRRTATETLTRRDRREYLDRLIGMVQTPLKYEVRPVAARNTQVELFIEGERYNLKRLYGAIADYTPGENFHGVIWTAEDGLPAAIGGKFLTAFRNAPTPGNAQAIQDEIALNRTKLQMSLARAQVDATERLNRDVQALDAYNSQAHEMNNRRVLPVVTAVTGQDLGESREAWTKWWVDQIGYRFVSPPSKPTFFDDQTTRAPSVPIYSCFGAGTPVQAMSGTVAIERLRVGDRVLTRDVKDGSLSYQPILAVHHNPPDTLLQIRLGEDSILSTGYHRFWKAGQGWVMARDLKPGDAIRTMSGVAKVEAISTRPKQPVYNLDVARTHSFFVGKQGELVHDNSLPEPELEPFDAVREDVASGKGEG